MLLHHAGGHEAHPLVEPACRDVVDGNVAALRLYERMGFVPTGVVQEHPNTPGATESEMVRLL